MKRFRRGDLAITCNSQVSVNNGHLVIVVEAIGQLPEWHYGFAYLIKRVDGRRFDVCVTRSGQRVPGGFRVYADQSRLRPLRDRPETTGIERVTRCPAGLLPEEVS